MLLGTIINALVVIAGGIIGVLLHNRFPQKIHKIVFQCIGLFNLLIGMQMAFKVENILVLLFALMFGGIIGESIDLEKQLERFGQFLKSVSKSKDNRFIEGFVTFSLLACIGTMAIIGPINEVLRGDRTLLMTKTIMDGFSSIALASALGIGVAFSAITILLYQGTISLLASSAQGFFTPYIINQLTAVGGLMIIGIGINLLEIKKIKVTNLLPALLLIVIFSLLIK